MKTKTRFDVDVPASLRLDTKAGVTIAIRKIPQCERRGATSYRVLWVSRPVDGRKVVTIQATFERFTS